MAVVGPLSTVMSLRGGLFLRYVPSVVRGDCVCNFLLFFAFPLDAGVWRLPAMAQGRMLGYVTLKKKIKFLKTTRLMKECTFAVILFIKSCTDFV